jgi:hypothetical protein
MVRPSFAIPSTTRIAQMTFDPLPRCLSAWAQRVEGAVVEQHKVSLPSCAFKGLGFVGYFPISSWTAPRIQACGE